MQKRDLIAGLIVVVGAAVACSEPAQPNAGSSQPSNDAERRVQEAPSTADSTTVPASRCRRSTQLDAAVSAYPIDASPVEFPPADASTIDAAAPPVDASCESEDGDDASSPPPPVNEAGGFDAMPSLRLEDALYLDGCFLTNAQVAADATSVFFASGCTSRLFVVARAPGHAVATVSLPANADAVAVTASAIYVSFGTREVVNFERNPPYSPVAAFPGSVRYGSIAAAGAQLYASTWQSRLAATSSRLFFSPLNATDRAREVAPASFAVLRELAAGTPGTTTVFDRAAGSVVGTIPNTLDTRGNALGGALRADESYLYELKPGCCGMGAVVYDVANLGEVARISFGALDDVMRTGRWLFGGTEGGEVVVWDFQSPSAARIVGYADLRAQTGHLGSEDIELRAIWVDAHDRQLFAGSSWGNDQSRGPGLPSAFVLSY